MVRTYSIRKRKAQTSTRTNWICSLCQYEAKNKKGLSVHLSSCSTKHSLSVKKSRRILAYKQRNAKEKHGSLLNRTRSQCAKNRAVSENDVNGNVNSRNGCTSPPYEDSFISNNRVLLGVISPLKDREEVLWQLL